MAPSGQNISVNVIVTCNMFNFHINIIDSTNQQTDLAQSERKGSLIL